MVRMNLEKFKAYDFHKFFSLNKVPKIICLNSNNIYEHLVYYFGNNK